TRARRWVWELGRAGVVALGYFLSAKVGLAFVVQPEGLAAVWPPSGFLLAVLVLSPQRAWAVILGGVLCSNTVANLTAGLSLTISLGFSLANCAESMTAAWLLVRFLGTPLTMTTLRDVMGLTGLAVIASIAVWPAWHLHRLPGAGDGGRMEHRSYAWAIRRCWSVSRRAGVGSADISQRRRLFRADGGSRRG